MRNQLQTAIEGGIVGLTPIEVAVRAATALNKINSELIFARAGEPINVSLTKEEAASLLEAINTIATR